MVWDILRLCNQRIIYLPHPPVPSPSKEKGRKEKREALASLGHPVRLASLKREDRI